MAITFEDPVKQEVWETLCRLNDCWTKGDAKDVVNYFHQEMVVIMPTERKRLEGRDACVAEWVGFSSKAKITHWKAQNPQIQIHGNAAVVTYYYDLTFEKENQTIKTSGCDMFVFIKEDDKWWAVADQFSSFPE